MWLRIEFRSDHNRRRSHAVPTNFVRATKEPDPGREIELGRFLYAFSTFLGEPRQNSQKAADCAYDGCDRLNSIFQTWPG